MTGDPKHQAVDGGFICQNCGATRQTPLGISRHRTMCNRRYSDPGIEQEEASSDG